MKNLKIYLSIAFISLITSFILLACSNENQDEKTLSSSENIKNQISTNKSASITSGVITCYISGFTVFNANTESAYSAVNTGSVTTYQYNSTPAVSNIIWSIVPGTVNPAGSITINSSGSTATVTVNSNFVSTSIQAIGTDSTGQVCGPILPIIKSTDNNGDVCCTPILSASYICRGSGAGSAGGTIDIELPSTSGGNNCTVTWSSISKIDLDLSDGTRFTTTNPSNIYNQNQGTLTYPYILNNNKIRLAFHNQECTEIGCVAVFYFNNGCPPVTASVTTLGPLETSL